ncbi:hypothetical protein IWQ60_004380 [Tieghemiomyces parasiticus]|uniref:Uncharacterized protein n=1 Tax=Tieghemiomyces parasiticus TaxID=78921 RepID=A0A9W8ADT2_9FUNG|nr:hypothetical protein IWQ60_004380 [Tieghemiomyces parasiticus]
MADLEDHFTRAAQPVANDTHATGNADMHRAVMARLAAEVRTSSLDHEADLFSNMGGFGEPFGEDEARRALAGVIDDWGTLDDEVSKEMEDQGPSS